MVDDNDGINDGDNDIDVIGYGNDDINNGDDDIDDGNDDIDDGDDGNDDIDDANSNTVYDTSIDDLIIWWQ